MSNLGLWSPWYNQPDPPRPYGDVTTYRVAEQWLKGLAVEDWGCGYGWFRTLHDGDYLGIDGTPGYADIVQDLTERRSETPGLLIRHVLEHNWNWADILQAADQSCTGTLVLVVFTPLLDDNRTDTIQIAFNPELGVPDLALPHRTLAPHFDQWTDITTDTQYGTERVYIRR